MLLVSYDISSDRVRGKFSKFLEKYGRRVQYSVFEVKNSKRVLNNITNEVECVYKPKFENTDSVAIFRVCEGCKNRVIKYGSMAHDEKDIVFF
ncbi:MAG TPA: CRISPR-associated endonuclease Cas2 [Candidatus Jacksonbacteria bacterium]|nr:MAG: CRISPR-associated endonuclease Cas2 [Candidatus Jacksonbacteria bacterium RIFCSPHIGHO2_02_FULL_43_10]HAZ16828.1 CRISPR-associated endonuclease Cas2 [Candidatus Jacksonbacteria bacterium]